MTVTQRVTWTCDRCNAVEYKDGDTTWQPDTWGSLNEASPPRKDLAAADDLGILCFSCRTDLRDWMTTPPDPDPEGTPR